jgi:hypothetical protein
MEKFESLRIQGFLEFQKHSHPHKTICFVVKSLGGCQRIFLYLFLNRKKVKKVCMCRVMLKLVGIIGLRARAQARQGQR